jgi:Xaa-Pro aminopeptidase
VVAASRNLTVGRALGGNNVGVESSCPNFAARLIGEEAKPMALRVIDDIMQSLRIIKAPGEIEMVKKSTAVAEVTAGELLTIIIWRTKTE